MRWRLRCLRHTRGGTEANLASLPIPLSADILQYMDRVEERFSPWVGDSPKTARPASSLRGTRKRRAVLSTGTSEEVGADFDTAWDEAQEISSDSEPENVISRPRKNKNKETVPVKILKRKGSPKLNIGRVPDAEDYSKLNTDNNEAIRANTVNWLDEAELFARRVQNR